ncbi:anhydro-N-acetylmuramic acid kinase [Salisediminibacterium selenitireducens]|uniref:Anhydro-N-acetylmuramic acid kinase n=1 Tax=Bacillus selenitireducens (strain ATCC 700615 / DSM 15326 / MLS10) TaxID=439292 RepID=D6XVX0_BACIE|nr:anhydro-N-acetylmuramic acid kinase [Salisediminibacterium selenitireducens]ADH97743.1 protein of unknown function UPF0075 [[Bacillus] selenitireducens MLS10]
MNNSTNVPKIELPIKKERVLAIGLMSGTSLDGIDAVFCEITGEGNTTDIHMIRFITLDYEDSLKQSILAQCNPETSSVDEICRLNTILGKRFAEAAKEVVKGTGWSIDQVDFISSHGQTIHHLPKERATLQIGELAVIAHETSCLTVGDFRPSDMAAGGEGAPLVPFSDALLFAHPVHNRFFLNIGGMSNYTLVPSQESNISGEMVTGSDIGPGNVWVDEMVKLITNGRQSYDRGGEIARSGVIIKRLLNKLIQEDMFYHEPFPKSTGREHYTVDKCRVYYDEGKSLGYSDEDLVTTMTAFTVMSISEAIRKLQEKGIMIDEIYVGGGGVHNQYMLDEIGNKVNIPVFNMERIGMDSDAKEAISFCVLGNEFLRFKHNNMPSVTNASSPKMMGKIVFP